MSTAMKLLVAAVAGTFFLAVISVFVVFSWYGTTVSLRNGVETQYRQNQNNYSNYFSTLRELAQVPEMYTDDLKKVWDGVIKGRYGADGSKAIVQVMHEAGVNVDSSMYTSIQQAIRSGRAAFEADQKMLLDKRNTFINRVETGLGLALSGFFGFSRDNIKDWDIVTNVETEEAFKTKKAAPIQLRPSASTN